MESPVVGTFGHRTTSDLVVRIQTHEGRDEHFYCHSPVLTKASSYFADRCQIPDSPMCVEVHCPESIFDHHVTLLRLLYEDQPMADLCNVKNALGMLRAAVALDCRPIVSACAAYLEATPWDESEEEEILKVVPDLGLEEASSVLARLRPVGTRQVAGVFVSALRLAMSGPPAGDARASAQEQIEYMLTEDDDPPLLTMDREMRAEAQRCMDGLLSRFISLVEGGGPGATLMGSYLSDLSWISRIARKLGICKEFIEAWVDMLPDVVRVVGRSQCVKIAEVMSGVMEAILCGGVILAAERRAHMARTWVRFARASLDGKVMEVDGEVWRSLESGLVAVILTLPSETQGEILTEWLNHREGWCYPDWTEAFEVWCYRSKAANRRLGFFDGGDNSTKANGRS